MDFLPSFGFRLIPVPGWLFSSVVATSLEWFRSVSAFQLEIVEWLPVELGLERLASFAWLRTAVGGSLAQWSDVTCECACVCVCAWVSTWPQ